MATGVDASQIDRAQESALRCARNASGGASVERKADCVACCLSEYGLKGIYRAPRTPWSEGALEACLQTCSVVDAFAKEDDVSQSPRRRSADWARGTWDHKGAESMIGDGFLTWDVPNRCVLRQYDTAKHRRAS